MTLLPDHRTIDVAFLWIDLAGYLIRVRSHARRAAAQLVPGRPPEGWLRPEADAAIEHWRRTDGLATAMDDLGAMLGGSEGTQEHPAPAGRNTGAKL